MQGSCWISGFQLINCSKSRLVKVMNFCPVESVIVNFGTRVLPSLLLKFDTYTFRPEQPRRQARNCFSANGVRRHQMGCRVLWTTGTALGIDESFSSENARTRLVEVPATFPSPWPAHRKLDRRPSLRPWPPIPPRSIRRNASDRLHARINKMTPVT